MSNETSDRLEGIQAELNEILEARLKELGEAVARTETATRRILTSEVEIERHRSQSGLQQGQLSELDDALAAARTRAQAIREQHDGILAERERARGDLARLEGEVREADSEVESTRNRVKQLEADAGTLRSENAALKTKLRTLQENISRMKRLREELMSSITGLTQTMSGLAGGGE